MRVVPAICSFVLLGTAACGGSDASDTAGISAATTVAERSDGDTSGGPAALGVEVSVPMEELARNHVDGTVNYDRYPPLGGDHNARWQECGFYTVPVPSERAVHSMEHGSIWIAYSPDVDQAQVEVLAILAEGQTHVLITPQEGLPAPVVATAWGFQIELSDADDPALETFIDAHIFDGPEPGAPCSGTGVGVPPEDAGGGTA